jgi:hypothetical protein
VRDSSRLFRITATISTPDRVQSGRFQKEIIFYPPPDMADPPLAETTPKVGIFDDRKWGFSEDR